MLHTMTDVRQYFIKNLNLEPYEKDYESIRCLLDDLVYRGIIDITFQERRIVAGMLANYYAKEG